MELEGKRQQRPGPYQVPHERGGQGGEATCQCRSHQRTGQPATHHQPAGQGHYDQGDDGWGKLVEDRSVEG
jgi:hypothetical protein